MASVTMKPSIRNVALLKKAFSFKFSSMWFLIPQCLIFIFIIWNKLVERLRLRARKNEESGVDWAHHHSRSQRLCSFWSEPRIMTTGWTQFFEHAQSAAVFCIPSQSDLWDSTGSSSTADLLCWSSAEIAILGVQTLGTRMVHYKNKLSIKCFFSHHPINSVVPENIHTFPSGNSD